MADDVFVVYSRRDTNAIRALAQALEGSGHTLWIDVLRLTPADDWRAALQGAIARAPAILVCCSAEWMYDVTFARTELDLLVDAIRRRGSPAPILPVWLGGPWRLTRELRTIPWLDVSNKEPAELAALSARLDAAASGDAALPVPSLAPTAILAALSAHIQRSSVEASRLRVLLRQHWNESISYMRPDGFEPMVALWAPVAKNPYFTVGHEHWEDEIETQCALHSVKCLLFQAHVHLAVRGDFDHHIPRAYAALCEIVEPDPYAETDGLDAESADVQNLNYRDALVFAEKWFSNWRLFVQSTVGVSSQEFQALERRVAGRRRQLDRLVRE